MNRNVAKKAAVVIVIGCMAGLAACGGSAVEESAAESMPVTGAEEWSTAEAETGAQTAEGDTGQQAEEAAPGDRIPMVMVNDTLYLDTGEESTLTARCGMMDGEITSTVDAAVTPSENDQSNFGSGYGYQYGEGDTIEIYINEKWCVFRAEGR